MALSRRVLVLALCFLLICSLPTASAFADGLNLLRTDKEAVIYIEDYANSISNSDVKYHIESKQLINAFTKEKSYALYTFLPSGYAIYDEKSGVIEEMSLEAEDPFEKFLNAERYYGGPMNYIAKIGNHFYLGDQRIKLSLADVRILTEKEQKTVESRTKIRAGSPVTYDFFLSSSSYFTTLLGNKFPDNTTGVCTQVACAIMLGYYNYTFHTVFVPSAYEDGVGTTHSFLSFLQIFMGTASSGLQNAANGLDSYFSYIGLLGPSANCDISNYSAVFNRVAQRVGQNKPTIIAMFSSMGAPYNHSVVAYGYRMELVNNRMSSASLFVHNGWKNNKLGVYSWDWFADSLYISH